jgi:hypothetical protein
MQGIACLSNNSTPASSPVTLIVVSILIFLVISASAVRN